MKRVLLFFEFTGRYVLFLKEVLGRFPRGEVFREMFMRSVDNVFWSSLAIVAVISLFMGAVATIQTAANIDSPLIPVYATGFAVRQSIILELSPTVIALILNGKIGSQISSEFGTMKITEQIDALRVMGINPITFLTLPYLVAALICVPLLVTISMILAILAGWFVSVTTGMVTSWEFIYGITYDFEPFHVWYALIKSELFAFVLVTIPAFFGFQVEGGAVNVGRYSTISVVSTGIAILAINYIVTQVLLL